jgi:hypothetical protein
VNVSTDTRITFHVQGGDEGRHTLSVIEFEDMLQDIAVQTVDDCEQEINEGGHWDDSEEGDLRRHEEITKLYDGLIAQASHVYVDGDGAIDCDPWYAVAQRMTCRITIYEVGGVA